MVFSVRSAARATRRALPWYCLLSSCAIIMRTDAGEEVHAKSARRGSPVDQEVQSPVTDHEAVGSVDQVQASFLQRARRSQTTDDDDAFAKLRNIDDAHFALIRTTSAVGRPTFHLSAGPAQYSFRVDEDGKLEHLYYGPFLGSKDTDFDLGDSALAPDLVFEPAPPGKATNKRRRCGERQTRRYEVPEFGSGDFRMPAVQAAVTAGHHCYGLLGMEGSRTAVFTYKSHRLLHGVFSNASGLPQLGMHDTASNAKPRGPESLVVELEDVVTRLGMSVVYVVFPGLSAVARRIVVRNIRSEDSSDQRDSRRTAFLSRAASASLDLSTGDWHLGSLHGCWGHERNLITRKIQPGTTLLQTRRGVSSHETSPVCVLSNGPLSEDAGECYGFALLYSGNWQIAVEQSYDGGVRVNVGVNPETFGWRLSGGQQEAGSVGVSAAGADRSGTEEGTILHEDCFETPECLLVYSGDGLASLSHCFHRAFRENLFAPRWRNHRCPVLLNTWDEAHYFGVNEEKVLALAETAAAVGVELLVLDDGWFGARDDDTSSLGDWTEHPSKFPAGLGKLAQKLKLKNLQLGIWMEPEMVSERSVLFRDHPDWVLHDPRRPKVEGRHQLVLDLSRVEVQDHVIETVSAVLHKSDNIRYLKWDMNRPLTDVFSAAFPPAEMYHRYVLGVYRVLRVVTDRFPHVLIESCSAGGGRMDPGMLAFTPQTWTSDNTDAFSRTKIQLGTSLWAPAACMGSHLTSVPNHQTKRRFSLKTRFVVALFGTFGLELDLGRLSLKERNRAKEAIALRQRLWPLVGEGTLYRLPGFTISSGPAGESAGISGNAGSFAWLFVSPNKKRALVSAVLFGQHPVGKTAARLRLRGLDPQRRYAVRELWPTEMDGEGDWTKAEADRERTEERRKFDFGNVVGTLASSAGTTRSRRPSSAVSWRDDEEQEPVLLRGPVSSRVFSGAALQTIGFPVHFAFDGDSALLELESSEPSDVDGD